MLLANAGTRLPAPPPSPGKGFGGLLVLLVCGSERRVGRTGHGTVAEECISEARADIERALLVVGAAHDVPHTCGMSVSSRDKAHFARIAEAMAAEREGRVREARERSPYERIVEGLALGALAPTNPTIEDALDQRALGQAGLSLRARRLGLRR